MGIVIAVVMLLGALALSPLPGLGWGLVAQRAGLTRALALALLAAGAWNALWHGLRHLQQFWGLAALVSGVLMSFAALLVWRRAAPGARPRRAASITSSGALVCLGLWACFAVYATALIRLNLGYPIWG